MHTMHSAAASGDVADVVFSVDFKPKIASAAAAAAAGERAGEMTTSLPQSTVLDSSLIREFRDFRRSGPPERFLCLEEGAWRDVPRRSREALASAFADGRTAVEVLDDGRSYVFDLLRMVRVDAATGASNPVAWIDVGGNCFFPGRDAAPRPKLEIEITINRDSSTAPASCAVSRKRKRDSTILCEERSDESNGMSISMTCPRNGDQETVARPKWSKVERLHEGDRFFEVVEKLFLSGMLRHAPGVAVTAVHKCSHGRTEGSARCKAFQFQRHVTAAARGDANVKFGWYGARVRDVAAAIDHGFGRANSDMLGSHSHGVGVHLSPPQCPYPSTMLVEADENGEAHVVLCRVIVGQPEAVPAGSTEFHPSSDEYDSGVDNVANPRWYIVWSTHMNTHILPEYVVSYRTSNLRTPNLQKQGSSGSSSLTKRSSQISMFPKLFTEIERCLPSSRIQTLERSYNRYKKGEMNKQHFIQFLRMFVGDKLLAMAVKKIRGC